MLRHLWNGVLDFNEDITTMMTHAKIILLQYKNVIEKEQEYNYRRLVSSALATYTKDGDALASKELLRRDVMVDWICLTAWYPFVEWNWSWRQSFHIQPTTLANKLYILLQLRAQRHYKQWLDSVAEKELFWDLVKEDPEKGYPTSGTEEKRVYLGYSLSAYTDV